MGGHDMREILFRGKCVDNGEWVYGDLQQMETMYILSKEKQTPPHIGCFWKPNMVIPETVGQFTGLTDKNGKKIFEGDVVRETFLATDVIGDIRYIDGCFDFVFKRDGREVRDYLKCLTCNHCVEIIGNIHDNPELLEDMR
jgi:uncharacterized phage protein (TIGR01671 family)